MAYWYGMEYWLHVSGMVQGTVYKRYILGLLAGKAGNTHINYTAKQLMI